jgi:MarR family transcriptional regulator for hemolysin
MPPAAQPPVGLQLARTQKAVSRAFAAAIAAAGGSLPTWLVLLALKTRKPATQRELADAVDIREATLTHHLNAMETDGLITRERDPGNRRVQRVELTPAGEARFRQLRNAARDFDLQLRHGLTEADGARLTRLLDRLRENVAEVPAAT